MNRVVMAIKRENKKIIGSPIWLSIDDISMAKVETKNGNATIVYYTAQGEYVHCSRVEHVFGAFEVIEGFVVTDRGMLGNFNKEYILNDRDKTIFFKDVSDFITIAATKFSYVIEIIKKFVLK